jgi:hypothetical protein
MGLKSQSKPPAAFVKARLSSSSIRSITASSRLMLTMALAISWLSMIVVFVWVVPVGAVFLA